MTFTAAVAFILRHFIQSSSKFIVFRVCDKNLAERIEFSALCDSWLQMCASWATSIFSLLELCETVRGQLSNS